MKKVAVIGLALMVSACASLNDRPWTDSDGIVHSPPQAALVVKAPVRHHSVVVTPTAPVEVAPAVVAPVAPVAPMTPEQKLHWWQKFHPIKKIEEIRKKTEVHSVDKLKDIRKKTEVHPVDSLKKHFKKMD